MECVFLVYSNMYKGFKCLDIATGRVYISRDVVFDENIFPFSKLHDNAGARLKSEIFLLPPTLLPNSINSGVVDMDESRTNFHNANANDFSGEINDVQQANIQEEEIQPMGLQPTYEEHPPLVQRQGHAGELASDREPAPSAPSTRLTSGESAPASSTPRSARVTPAVSPYVLPYELPRPSHVPLLPDLLRKGRQHMMRQHMHMHQKLQKHMHQKKLQ